MIGIWDRAAPMVERASRESGIGVTVLRVEDLLGDAPPRQLDKIRLLYVLNVEADKVEPLRRTLQLAKQADPAMKIVPLDQRDSHAALQAAELLETDAQVRTYWRSNGLQNLRRLLVYSSVTYLGEDGAIEPPVQVPDSGYYVPEHPEEAITDLAQVRVQGSWIPEAPVAAILIHQSFWITQDTKVIDAQIAALRARGFNAFALFAGKDNDLHDMLRALNPSLLIEDRHAGTWETSEGKSFLRELDVPYLRPISMLAYTTQQWLDDPQGLHVRDVGNFMSLQESNGTLEPIVIGGLKAGLNGFRLHEPIPDRIERFADRAVRWRTLREKPNREKRIAIIYYSKSLGKDDLLRGSPTGAFLDGPESLVRFLPRMSQRGFALGDGVPPTAAALLERVKAQGRNIGPWAQGELDAMADHAEVELIPLSAYMRWFNTKLGETHRKAVIEKHGPPPGKLMVVRRNGEPHIVLPILRLGNIVLAPQPERGEKQDEALLHSRDLPPPHHYLAFYWWLQDEFKADAIMHWGTHGTLELQPGKEAGLGSEDWSDICVGTMPVVNLWIMDNLGESTLSRRRSYALLVNHLVPPAVSVTATDDTAKLHEDVGKFYSLETGLVQGEYRKRITQTAINQRFVDTLNLPLDGQGLLEDEAMQTLHDHLHVVTESRTPTSLHILGAQIGRERVSSYLTNILGREFIDRVAALPYEDHHQGHSHTHGVTGNEHGDATREAERVIDQSVVGNALPHKSLQKDVERARDILHRLDQTDDEITNLLRGLEGRYVAPGPGPDPIRNSASVPSGRNLYSLNPEEVPTEAAWSVGKQLVEQMLKEHQPRKVGMDLNGMNTMRDFGVMEAQILYLMGVRPVWDANRLAIDVELIPSEELGRPRIDVFIAMGGQYKENFPSRVKLLDKAIRLVSGLDEPGNLMREGTRGVQQKLLDAGYSADRAETFAAARIFGTKPGNLSGTNILYLVPRSGVWEDDDEIASVYIDSMSYVYTGEVWGEQVDGLYEQAIQNTDTLVRVWASNMTSELSNHHAYEYLGGLSMAVKKLTGKEPKALIADVRDPTAARVRDFEEVLDTTLRSELLNEDWIRGMKEHDYAGAGMMAELVKNTFGWDVTRDSAVSDAVWNDIYSTYIEDRHELELQAWFDRANPHALQEITATMLEAARKGYWQASKEQLAEVSRRYAKSVAQHGPSLGLVSGGNTKLEEFTKERLGAGAHGALAEAYSAAMQQAAAPAGETSKVYGQKFDETKQATQPQASSSATDELPWWSIGLGAVAAALLLVGILRRTGSPA